MKRIPEPELMDGAAQAHAYARADFEEPNSRFVERFEALVGTPAGPVLDLGCGPADIPLRLARRHPELHVDALDGADAMLAFAREALAAEPHLASRVTLVLGDLAEAPLPRAPYAAVISNSLLHHLHDPGVLWRRVCEAAAPGAHVVVMDLFRPESRRQARSIVDTYGAGEPGILRRDFHNSLLAAFTPEEVEEQLAAVGLDGALAVARISDRHLLVSGRMPSGD